MEWQPIKTAPSDGTRIVLRFHDSLGYYELRGECFLHDNGKFYRIEPPCEIGRPPTHWKPAV